MTDIYRGRRFWVEKREVAIPGKPLRDRVIVHPGSAVAILPLDGDSCYLIRQYRYPLGTFICEVPAGMINDGEAPEETAHRELIEETGLAAERLIPRGYIWTTPGFTDEKIYLFEARDLSPSQAHRMDEDEVIERVRVPLASLPDMIAKGSISDAKTICLITRCLITPHSS